MTSERFGFTRIPIFTVLDIYAASDVAAELGGGPRDRFDQLGIRPSYARYRADGTLTITDDSGTVTENGELIYEFNHVGRPDRRAPVS